MQKFKTIYNMQHGTVPGWEGEAARINELKSFWIKTGN